MNNKKGNIQKYIAYAFVAFGLFYIPLQCVFLMREFSSKFYLYILLFLFLYFYYVLINHTVICRYMSHKSLLFFDLLVLFRFIFS